INARGEAMPAVRAPIAVTMGDPAGIGPEIVAKLWAEGDLPPAFVIGDMAIMRRAVDLLGVEMGLRRVRGPTDVEPRPRRLDVLPASELPSDLSFGRVDARAGAAA